MEYHIPGFFAWAYKQKAREILLSSDFFIESILCRKNRQTTLLLKIAQYQVSHSRPTWLLYIDLGQAICLSGY